MLKSGEIIVAPGIGDALSAKIAAYAGIKALTMGGYSVSASRLGQPDVGFLSCKEMAEQQTGICNDTDLPVVADGDTGYGNALNVIRTEQMFEQAGAACIFFEDQAWPKRCGHMDGKQVISAGEHAQKIRAAVDARLDKETMIMSRPASRAVYGIDDAIDSIVIDTEIPGIHRPNGDEDGIESFLQFGQRLIDTDFDIVFDSDAHGRQGLGFARQ